MKNLIWALLLCLTITATNIYSQGTPPVAIGAYFTATDLFYEYSYSETGHEMTSDFWKYAARYNSANILFNGNHKWYPFVSNLTIHSQVDTRKLYNIVLFQFKNVRDTSIVFTVPVILRIDGKVRSILGQYYCPIPAYPGDYYLRIVNTNGHPIWYSQILTIADGTVHHLKFDSPSKVYGANLKQMTDGRYVVRTGDCDADGYVDGSDYAMMFNYQGATGFRYTDFNINSITNGGDFTALLGNIFTGEVFPPGMGDSKRWGVNQSDHMTDYRLVCTAESTIPDPRVRYFKISMSGDFNLGFSQFIIKLNRSVANASISLENFDNTIPHNIQIVGDEIRFGILPVNGVRINGNIELARLRVSSSEIISDVQIQWKNEQTPFATEIRELINNQMVEITNVDNHYVSNLTNVNGNTTIPNEFVLNQNYPNPFNPITVISYQLPKAEFVNLQVYDALGKVVTNLVNEKQQAGTYEVKFDGSGLSSGIYFYKLTAGKFMDKKSMILIK